MKGKALRQKRSLADGALLKYVVVPVGEGCFVVLLHGLGLAHSLDGLVSYLVPYLVLLLLFFSKDRLLALGNTDHVCEPRRSSRAGLPLLLGDLILLSVPLPLASLYVDF